MAATMSLRDMLRYFAAPVLRPRAAMEALIEDRCRVAYGLLIYLFLGAIYTFTVQMAYSRGFGAQVMPFLAIPAERYYFWQRFYQIPLFLAAFIVFAGTARLMALAFRGTGSFESASALCAVAMTLPMLLTMWVPETILFYVTAPGYSPPGARGVAWQLFHAIRQMAGILWPLVLIAMGLARSERIHGAAAVLATVVAFLPTGALMVVFIR